MAASNANGSIPWKWISMVGSAVLGLAAIVSALWTIFQVAFESHDSAAKIIALQSDKDKLEKLVRTNELEISGLRRDLNEIETQFCQADDLRNLIHAQDIRNYSLLFEKVFGQKYPSGDAYYPKVCNRAAPR